MAEKILNKEEQRDLNEKLYDASFDGKVKYVRRLISENADVNYLSDRTGLTVLGTAALKNHVSVLEILLKYGAEINKKDWDGRTGVHLACMNGNVDALKFLVKNGASLHDKDNYGKTGVHRACENGRVVALKFLVQNGASLHDKDNKVWIKKGHGKTPLMILKEETYVDSLNKDRQECLKFLMDQIDAEESTLEEFDQASADSDAADQDTDANSPGSKTDQPESSSSQAKVDKAKDDHKMAQLVCTKIKEQGEMRLRNVKGMLTGPPGVGKTVTIQRLTGRIRNITLDGPSSSTGIEKPLTIPLYHDTEKKSLVIEKNNWSPQLIDQEAGTFFQCLSHTTPKYQEAISGSATFFVEFGSNSAPLLNDDSMPSSLKPMDTPATMLLEKRFHLLQEFIRKAKWNEAQTLLKDINDLTLFHVIDTGGQPEFFEVLPLLLRGPCFSLIFFNLAHSLMKPFSVTYRHTPTSHSLVEYDSTYTQLEMIHMLLASLHSLNYEEDSSQTSAAFLIGTHLDKAKKDDIQKIEKEIEESLNGKSFYEDDILAKYHALERKVNSFLYALDNVNGDEKEISTLREILTELIQQIFPAKPLPTSWGIFHLMLRHKYEGNGLCTLEESITLGEACGLEEESEVIMALKFFRTHFGTILYYNEVKSMQSQVICDPNLLFRPITKIVAESFGANPYRQETAKKIRQTGEIAYDFFEQVCKENDPDQRISTRAIVDLLKYHNIVSEISNGNKRLFMSCLLRPCPPDESGSNSPVDPASLLFTFQPHGYQPISLFHVLTSKLLRIEDFVLDKKRYRNKITFLYGQAEVEILSTISYLRVCVKNCSKQRCTFLRKLLRKTQKKIFKEVPHMKGTEVRLAFFCPKSLANKSPHIATLHCYKSLPDEEQPSRVLLCEICKDQRTAGLEKHHEVWLEDVENDDDEEEADQREVQHPAVQMSVETRDISQNVLSERIAKSRPERSEVFSILRKKSARWNLFALELQISDDERDQLRGKNMSDLEKLDEVLRKWMESESRPITWSTILDVLNSLEMKDLAREVLVFLEDTKADSASRNSDSLPEVLNESRSRKLCTVL